MKTQLPSWLKAVSIALVFTVIFVFMLFAIFIPMRYDPWIKKSYRQEVAHRYSDYLQDQSNPIYAEFIFADAIFVTTGINGKDATRTSEQSPYKVTVALYPLVSSGGAVEVAIRVKNKFAESTLLDKRKNIILEESGVSDEREPIFWIASDMLILDEQTVIVEIEIQANFGDSIETRTITMNYERHIRSGNFRMRITK